MALRRIKWNLILLSMVNKTEAISIATGIWSSRWFIIKHAIRVSFQVYCMEVAKYSTVVPQHTRSHRCSGRCPTSNDATVY